MNVEDYIDEMKEEAAGSRGVFYENFGSAIREILNPLSTLLEQTKDDYPELVEEIARKMYRGY